MKLLWREFCLVTSLFALAAGSVRAGEPIILSKPDLDNRRVSAEDSKIPQNEVRAFTFGPQPPPPTSPLILPPVQRIPQRKQEKRSLFDEPDLFSDKSAHDGESGIAPSKRLYPLSGFEPPWQRDSALSPIRQFTGPRESSEETATSRQRDRIDLSILHRDGRDERSSRFDSLRAPIDPGVKRELSHTELERKTEFERMINPVAGAQENREQRGASPISSMDTTVRIPIPLLPQTETPSRSLDPMHRYAEEQRHWTPSSVEDTMNRRVLGANAPVPKPVLTPGTVDRRPPLMRQPTFQEFPSRRF